MEEIIEGCFKLFFGILFVLAAPVIILIYAWYGLCWLCKHFEMWWAANTTHVMVGLALVLGAAVLALVVRAAWSCFCHWWELRQIRIQAARAIQRTNAHYEKSRAEMDRLARAYRLRKGIGQ